MNGTKVLEFYAVIGAVVILLRLFSNSFVSRVAFSWLGPKPAVDETWAAYQWRWAVYSLGWLIQIMLLFALVNGVLIAFPQIQQHQLLLAFQFGLTLGLGMALLAFVAFVARAAKARFFGPNPTHKSPPSSDTGTR